ncbi:glycine dehydrogenase, partial [Candidatus Sumerlaeota bacterium]|nr:glycine dehydrogenase [Candidatus Sumerlaeota bacterium]
HDALTKLKGAAPLARAPFFNEFTIRLPISAEDFYGRMKAKGVLAGLPAARLGAYDANLLIICATETKLQSDLDLYLETAKAILE